MTGMRTCIHGPERFPKQAPRRQQVMNEAEIEHTIMQIRELRRTASAATSAADSMELRLLNAGIELEFFESHTSWRRTRPARSPTP